MGGDCRVVDQLSGDRGNTEEAELCSSRLGSGVEADLPAVICID